MSNQYPDYEGMLEYWGFLLPEKQPMTFYRSDLSQGPFSIIEPSAQIGEDCYIGPYTHIMANTKVGRNVTLEGCFLEGPIVGDGARIYRNTHIMQGARIGKDCLIGANCFIADGAVIGEGSRLMLNVGIGRCTTIGKNVYMGPNTCLANSDPRDGKILTVEVGDNAVIGTNAVSTHNVRRIGKNATIGAGAVVTKDVPDYAIVVGNPARIIGYNTVTGEAPNV